MKKYILISGDKGSYDRPIELNIIKIFDNLKEASDYLINYCVYPDEKIKYAIKEKQQRVEVNYNYYYYLNYTNDLLTYYSTGCPTDNEYDGETEQIFEIEV